MAIVYCDYDLSTGLNDGTTWANAYQTFKLAFTPLAAGDTLYVQGVLDEYSDHYTISKIWNDTPILIYGVMNGTTAEPPTSNDLIKGFLTGSSIPAYEQVGIDEAPVLRDNSDGWRINFSTGNIYIYGLKFESSWAGSTFISSLNNEDAKFVFDECEVYFESAANIGHNYNSEGYVLLNNSSFVLKASNQLRQVNGKLIIRGGKISDQSGVRVLGFFTGSGDIELHNVDTSTVDVLFSGVQNYGTRVVNSCALSGSQNSTQTNKAASALVFNQSGEYHNFARYSYRGIAKESTTVYLNASYDGTNKYSLLFESLVTSTPNSLQNKLCELPAQDLSVTDTTYRVNLLLDTDTAATLTDTNCWVELSHNDNNSLALGKIVSSRNNDILVVGTELTPSAEVWQGTLPTNTKAYQIDITLSAASLPNVTNGSVVIYLNLAVANTDVYACPAVMIGT